MASCGLVFGVFGGLLARAFTSDTEVVRITTQLLFVAAFFQVLDAVNVVLRGSLRGAEDVAMIAVIGIGVVWCCVPTAAFLLGKVAGLGALGGWIGFVFETTIGATLFGLRWRRGAWRRTRAAGESGRAPAAQAEAAAA